MLWGNIVLTFVLSGWGLGFKLFHGLLMYTYNFLFLCFSLNPFLHGILACIFNFYQQTRMDRPTDKVRYRSSLPELNKFWFHTCVLTTLIFFVWLTIKLLMDFQQLNVIFWLFATLTRLGCFGVTAILSWGWLKLKLIEVEVDWSWGWLELRLIAVEVDWSWGWLKLK